MERPGVKNNLACIGQDRAGQDPHQGGLPGTIFTDQRMDLTSANLEVDMVDGMDATKPLVYLTHLKQRLWGHS
jgi:hypothetical protein